jgi:CheY-like chemotaxis protein
MPNGRGDWLIARLKADPRTADIPILVLTGVRGPETAQQMDALGAAEVLNKPTPFSDLLEALKRIVALPEQTESED